MNGLRRAVVGESGATPVSLLERLRQQPDNPSWQRLTKLYLPLVRRNLQRHGLPQADVEDLAQEVMLAIVRAMPEFEHCGRAGAFRTWLRTVTLHRLRGYWRSRQNGPQHAFDEELDRLADSRSDLARLWDKEHDEFVLQRLLELVEPEFSPAAWHAFRRQSIDGWTAGQTALELGVTANAVLIAKSRVLRRLRQEARGLID
jgi:RNA polymerase sigma-70 factor, ECF subfamily